MLVFAFKGRRKRPDAHDYSDGELEVLSTGAKRVGAGESRGGVRGVMQNMQRTTVQGSPRFFDDRANTAAGCGSPLSAKPSERRIMAKCVGVWNCATKMTK